MNLKERNVSVQSSRYTFLLSVDSDSPNYVLFYFVYFVFLIVLSLSFTTTLPVENNNPRASIVRNGRLFQKQACAKCHCGDNKQIHALFSPGQCVNVRVKDFSWSVRLCRSPVLCFPGLRLLLCLGYLGMPVKSSAEEWARPQPWLLAKRFTLSLQRVSRHSRAPSTNFMLLSSPFHLVASLSDNRYSGSMLINPYTTIYK